MKLKSFLAAALLAASCAAAPAAGTDLLSAPEAVPAAAEDPIFEPVAAPAREAVERLTAKGINARDRSGNTPLILAARAGDAELTASLLERGAKIDARGKSGMTALMNAAFFSDDTAALKTLLKAGADANAADKKGWTALMFAIYANPGTEAAETLLKAGADANAANKDGWTPLMLALRTGKPAAFVRRLLKDWGARAENHKNARDGATPMMIACQYANDPRLVTELYEAGAEATRPRGNGEQPLHFAARNQNDCAAAIIALLLDLRAEINCADRGGWTPLMIAAQFSGSVRTVQALLDADAQVNARNGAGMTPVMLAATNETPAAAGIVRALIAAGADLTLTDWSGRTPFMAALRAARDAEIVRLLAAHEPESAVQKQETLIAVAPAAQAQTDYLRTINAPRPASRAVTPPKDRTAATAVRKLLVSYDIIASPDASPDLSPDVTAALSADEAEAPRPSFYDLLVSYDLRPQPLAPGEGPLEVSVLSQTPASADEPAITAALPTLAAGDLTDARAQKRAGRRHEPQPAALYDISFESETAADSQPQPAIAPGKTSADTAAPAPAAADPEPYKPRNRAPSVSRSALMRPAQPFSQRHPAPSAAVSTDADADPFPAKTLAAADVTAAQSDEARAQNEESARSLAGSLAEAARQKSVRGNAREFPRSKADPLDQSGAGNAPVPAQLLAGVAKTSRLVSRPAYQASRLLDSKSSRYTKRRGLKKMRPAFRRDATLVTPLMLAAVNPYEAAPEIIAWLLERGEQLEARDGEGRTALVCAVRYNASPLAAQALIEAGADTRVTFGGNPLRRLLRYNTLMSAPDKRELARLLGK